MADLVPSFACLGFVGFAETCGDLRGTYRSLQKLVQSSKFEVKTDREFALPRSFNANIRSILGITSATQTDP